VTIPDKWYDIAGIKKQPLTEGKGEKVYAVILVDPETNGADVKLFSDDKKRLAYLKKEYKKVLFGDGSTGENVSKCKTTAELISIVGIKFDGTDQVRSVAELVIQ